jgi:hypothetical protein
MAWITKAKHTQQNTKNTEKPQQNTQKNPTKYHKTLKKHKQKTNEGDREKRAPVPNEIKNP